MRNPILLASFVVLLLSIPFAIAQPLPGTCVEANGLTWCYNPSACGQACNDVCAAFGGTPVADSTAWLQAQDTAPECQAISQAFGLGTQVSMANYTYACLSDESSSHTAPGGVNSPLLCSTYSDCPDNHRTQMDDLGVSCGANSRRSICPCENIATVAGTSTIPTLSQGAVILIAMALAALGFITLKRRRTT